MITAARLEIQAAGAIGVTDAAIQAHLTRPLETVGRVLDATAGNGIYIELNPDAETQPIRTHVTSDEGDVELAFGGNDMHLGLVSAGGTQDAASRTQDVRITDVGTITGDRGLELDIIADYLLVESAGDVGSFDGQLALDVNQITVSAPDGQFASTNVRSITAILAANAPGVAFALEVGGPIFIEANGMFTVDGSIYSGDTIDVIAPGAITVKPGLIIRGKNDVTLYARDTEAVSASGFNTADSINLGDDVVIESVSGNLTLLSGDDFVVNRTHRLIATQGRLTIGIDLGNADLGKGASFGVDAGNNTLHVPDGASGIITAQSLYIVSENDDDEIIIPDLFLPTTFEAGDGFDSVDVTLSRLSTNQTKLTNIDVDGVTFTHAPNLENASYDWLIDTEPTASSIDLFPFDTLASVNTVFVTLDGERILEHKHTRFDGFKSIDARYTLSGADDHVRILELPHPLEMMVEGGSDSVTVGGTRADGTPIHPGRVSQPLMVVADPEGNSAGDIDTFTIQDDRDTDNIVPVGRIGISETGTGLVSGYDQPQFITGLESTGTRIIEFRQFEQVVVNLGATNSIFTILDTVAPTVINAGGGNDVINVRNLSNPTTINLDADPVANAFAKIIHAGDDTVNIQGGGELLTIDGGGQSNKSLDLPNSGDRLILGATRNFNTNVVNVSDARNAISMDGTGWEKGQEVMFTTDGVAPRVNLPGSPGQLRRLEDRKVYYVVPLGQGIIRLAETRQQALAANERNENDANLIKFLDGGLGEHQLTLTVNGQPLWPTVNGSLTRDAQGSLLSFAPSDGGPQANTRFSDIEKVNILLGLGDDRFEVDDPSETFDFELRGGPGNDEIILKHIGKQAVIRGDSGSDDRLKLLVEGNPIPDQFAELQVSAGIERLVVDNETNIDVVNWIVSQGSLYFVDGNEVLNSSLNSTTNQFTFSTSIGGTNALTNGERIVFTSTNLPSPLNATQFYRVMISSTVSGQTTFTLVDPQNQNATLQVAALAPGANLSFRRLALLANVEGVAKAEILAGKTGDIKNTLEVISPLSSTINVDGNELRVIDGAVVLAHENSLEINSFPTTVVDGLLGVQSVVSTKNHFVYAAGTDENKIAIFKRIADPNADPNDTNPSESVLRYVGVLGEEDGVPSVPGKLILSPASELQERLYVIGDDRIAVFAIKDDGLLVHEFDLDNSAFSRWTSQSI